MSQYIDKSALVAQIKKLKIDIGNIFNEYDEGFWEGRATAFDDVICALNNFEVKEVDLEKEIDNYIDTMEVWEIQEAPLISIENTAKHFFELGLKARKRK